MSEESRNDGTIRLLFEMAREDNPPLYDDLVRFSKGSKRVNRLRLLAYDGLLAQNGVLVSDGLAARADGHGAGAEEGASAVTNDLFAPAIEA